MVFEIVCCQRRQREEALFVNEAGDVEYFSLRAAARGLDGEHPAGG
jgi:hypothetical protein